MPGNYWIKLYLEILDDSKMAVLPDRLWRRTIELFLLAGRYGKEGALPDTIELAWALRMATDDLELDMRQIASTGIIERTTGGWMVTQFAKRQAPLTPAEKMQLLRDKQKREQYYNQSGDENVTNLLPKVTQINRLTESDTESYTDTKKAAAVFTAYQNNIGQLSSLIADEINDLIKEYTADWVLEAIRVAVIQEKRSLAYVKGILKRWKRDGFENRDKKQSNNGSKPDTDLDRQRLAQVEAAKDEVLKDWRK